MAEVLYKKIAVELYKNYRYPRKEFYFTGNDIWGLVKKQITKNL